MVDYVKITITDGNKSIPLSVPKGAMINGQSNKTYEVKEGSIVKMTKEQFLAAQTLAKLDGNGEDLDKDDFIKFKRMTKAQQSEYINKALNNKSTQKVGKLFSPIDDTESGIVSSDTLLIVPMTPGGATVDEDSGNLFWMQI